MLAAHHVSREYTSGARALTVLRDVTFTLAPGSSLAVVGPSGSGKTTLLGLCAGLDRPSSGSIEVDGQDLSALDEDALAHWRATSVGFVFQDFRLLPTLTALENVMVPLEILGRGREASGAAEDLLERVGLSDRLDHVPARLSGGEQQRVALARAFVNRPRWLLADEPTGNLDEETSAPITELLFEQLDQQQAGLILVTHDAALAARTDRRLMLRAGMIVPESP